MFKNTLAIVTILIFSVNISAQELIEFRAGDPVYASSINQNFSLLLEQIEDLKRQLGELSSQEKEFFNVDVVGGVSLEDGYNYFITDVVYEVQYTYVTQCYRPSESYTATINVDAREILQIGPQLKPSGTSYQCTFLGQKYAYNTPLEIRNGGVISVNSLSVSLEPSVRLIGYRLPVAP